MKKAIPALILAICLCFAMSVSAFAASTTTATVPVTLTVANNYRAVNVTLPAALPIEINNGTVITADNANIVNNSKNGAIQVTDISVTSGAYKVGNYEDFSGAKTIALKINGCTTKGEGKLAIDEKAFPVIAAGGKQSLTYFAKVSGDAPNATDVQAANVVITISIAD